MDITNKNKMGDRMKRIIKFVIAMGCILFIFQFAVTFFINKHEVIYTLSQKENTYTIKEQFQKINKNHYYNFEVLDKEKNKFIFYYNEDYKKKKKVVKEIETYKEGNIYCIAPVMKDNQLGGIVCRNNNELVSGEHLKRNGISLENFKNALKTKGYVIEDTDAVSLTKDVTVYNHFPKEYTVAIWNYHGLHIVKNDHTKNLSVLNDDYYENTLGILVGNHYVIADTDQNFSYSRIYIVDIEDESKDFVDLEIEISKDSYFLGAVDGNVYIMDRDKKKEYAFNVKERKIEEIGNTDTTAKMYYHGNWEEKNIYTVSDNKEIFQMEEKIKAIEELYHPKLVRETVNKYYFVTDDNAVYYVMKNDLKTKVLLFQDNTMKDLKLLDDNLFFLSNENIIMYNLKNGYRKVVTHSELLYNNKNIFEVIKK